METIVIKDAKGRRLGTVTKHPNGDETARDFYGKIVARYIKEQNMTRDFYGRIVATGNVAAGLLLNR